VTPFEHLAVLISIVLGLGLTHLLTSVQRLVQARQRVRLYWLPLLWVALIFVSLIEWWWASFALRQHAVWNFFYFLFVLLSPVSLYLAAAFVLPDVEPGARLDLREHYYDNRRWFFAMLAASPALDAVRRALEAGSWTDFGAISNAVAAALVGSLAASRRPSHHALVTVSVGALFLFFIVDAALQLR
jgi:hypothetical protein